MTKTKKTEFEPVRGICSLQLLTWTASFFALIYAISNSFISG